MRFDLRAYSKSLAGGVDAATAGLLVQQVSLKYLSSYLSITDTSLSRTWAGRRPAADGHGNADGASADSNS